MVVHVLQCDRQAINVYHMFYQQMILIWLHRRLIHKSYHLATVSTDGHSSDGTNNESRTSFSLMTRGKIYTKLSDDVIMTHLLTPKEFITEKFLKTKLLDFHFFILMNIHDTVCKLIWLYLCIYRIAWEWPEVPKACFASVHFRFRVIDTFDHKDDSELNIFPIVVVPEYHID